MEQKIDSLTDALAMVQHVLMNKETKNEGKDNSPLVAQADMQAGPGNEVVIVGESETTIYKNAVESHIDGQPQIMNTAATGLHEPTQLNIEK